MISRPLLSNHLSCRYHAISYSVALYLIIILAVLNEHFISVRDVDSP